MGEEVSEVDAMDEAADVLALFCMKGFIKPGGSRLGLKVG